MDGMSQKLEQVQAEVNKVIKGKEDVVKKVLAAVIAGGHILMEDIPGVGKTTLATTFAKSMSMHYKRVQFTPDVLPSDILGFSMYNSATKDFEYREGAVFTNLFLADEINRTSPKTQSALLEVMEEKTATVDGVTRPLPDPFVVIATENPYGSSGTQMLPESQLDRFMICMSMGYPDLKSEIEIAKGKSIGQSYESIEGVMTGAQLQAMKETVENIFIHDRIYEYMMALIHATRKNPYIELGVSPRGMVALTKMVRANAFLNERDYVIPADVEDVFYDVTKHRIVLNTKARVTGVSGEAVLEKIMEDTTKPTSFKGKE